MVAARAFLPRVRRLLGREHVPWPAAFAAATNHHLQQTLNLNWKCLTEPPKQVPRILILGS